TARVWKNFQQVHELRGHSHSVWTVLAVDDDQTLTGSADKTIALWQGNKLVHRYTGHTDAVRGLSVLAEGIDIGFASCSNDSTVRLWTLGGDLLHQFDGHTSFVYSLASIHDTGSLVSSGEDRTVRVWEDGELVQTITHPAISVWAVDAMPNGDIVTGCSDGIVRVFSRSESRWADEATLKEYESQVASQAIPSEQVGDVKKTDLPGPEALERPGNKDGQVIMVKTVGGSVEAHEWSAGQGKWVKVGEVVDAVGQNRKQLFEGKEYDYVFKVDIKDGEPPLSLPYNATDNPYTVAQQFLARNDLPVEYIDQVVSFIEKNAGGVKIQSSREFVDPYTGASRYQASPAAGTPSTNTNSYADPFTGANRYAPPSSTPINVAPTPPPPKPANPILPVKMPLAFKQANIPAMENKFKQLNDGLSGDPNTSSLALTPLEFKLFNRSFVLMKSKAHAPPLAPADSAAELSQKDVDIITDVLARWPSLQRFP
ncbi:hypothetical protein FS749_014266, partial [Ceratobasidium sp. UAMH 11750]